MTSTVLLMLSTAPCLVPCPLLACYSTHSLQPHPPCLAAALKLLQLREDRIPVHYRELTRQAHAHGLVQVGRALRNNSMGSSLARSPLFIHHTHTHTRSLFTLLRPTASQPSSTHVRAHTPLSVPPFPPVAPSLPLPPSFLGHHQHHAHYHELAAEPLPRLLPGRPRLLWPERLARRVRRCPWLPHFPGVQGTAAVSSADLRLGDVCLWGVGCLVNWHASKIPLTYVLSLLMSSSCLAYCLVSTCVSSADISSRCTGAA